MGDWEGEFTYVGARGSSVIDYIIVNEYIHDKVLEFKVDDRVDSDHLPLAMMMEGTGRQDAEEGDEEDEELNTGRKIINWDKEARRLYFERTTELGSVEWQKSWSVEEKWRRIKKLIHSALIYKEVKKPRTKEIGYKDWWIRSCTRKKREVKRKYKRWKKGRGRREDFMEGRRDFRELLERRRKDKRAEEEEELRNLRNEKEIWRFINRRRKKKEWTENNIQGEEWRKHFMKLLGGTEKEITMKGNGTERKIGEEGDGTTIIEIRGEKHERYEQEEERELEEGEIAEAVMRMKIGKAAGIDGIPMEALRFCGSAVKGCLVDLIKQIWKEGTIPSEWKTSIVVPLYKRGDKEKAENYRGISLLCLSI